MRIDRLHIDGFGRALDADLRLGPGLTLIKGPNGAGKTTVHEFIHAVLFGLVKDEFPLVRGGTRGGRMTGVLASGAAFEVQRHGDPVTGGGQKVTVTIAGVGDGTPEALLGLVTGGVTRAVFESVFAFGQDELHDLKYLTAKEVADRIYGASIGVIADVLKVEAALGGDIDNLWKRAGQNPSLNRAVVSLAGKRTLLASRDLPAEYGTLRHQLEAIETEQAVSGGRLAQLEAEARDAALLEAAYSQWQTLAEARAALGGLPLADVVTADALIEEGRLRQVVDAAEVRATGARARREALDEESASIAYRVEVVDRGPDIDAAVAESASWQARDPGTADQRRRLDALKLAMADALGEAGWDEARLEAFDPAAVRAALAAHYREDLEGPERAAMQPQARLRQAQEAEALARAALERLDGSTSGAGGAGESSLGAGRAEALDREADQLMASLARVEGLRSSIAATPTVAPVPVMQEGLPAGGTPTAGSTAGGSLVPALGVGGLGVVAGVLLAVLVNPMVGGAVVLVSLVLAAIMAMRGGGAGRAGGSTAADAMARDARSVITPAEHPLAATLRAAESDLDTAFAAAGLPLPPTDAGPAELRRRASALRAEAATRRESADSRERAATTLAAATAEHEQAGAAVAEAQVAITEGRDRWAESLAAAGLPPTLDYAGATGLLARLESAKGNLAERIDLGKAVGRSEREWTEWSQGIAQLAADLGVEADEDPYLVVRRLRVALASERTARSQKDALGVQRDAAGREERDAEEALRLARTDYGAFLALHKVASAEQLHQLHDQTSERGKAEERALQAEASFAALVPEDRRADIETVLRAADPDALAARSEAIGREVAALREQRELRKTDEGTLGERLRRLEDEADTSRIRQELADGRASLEVDARRWYVLRTALALLRRTRAEYEAKHRPAVLARAEVLFCEWTAGEYSGFANLAETGLTGVVSEADGKVVPLGGLSRGTAEQLYLAMRIALVEHLATQQEPLPLVMDDVLVNFDPDRAQRVARSIEKVAAEHQVIYLTCHAEVALKPTRTILLGRNVEVVEVIEAAV